MDGLEQFIDFLTALKDALEVQNQQVFIKHGPVGTLLGIEAVPLPSKLIQEFAEQHGMNAKQGMEFIASIDSIDEGIRDRFFGLIDVIETGAKKAGMEFRDYAATYLKGMDTNNLHRLSRRKH